MTYNLNFSHIKLAMSQLEPEDMVTNWSILPEKVYFVSVFNTSSWHSAT